MNTRKVRTSLSLSDALVRRIDERAEEAGESRSALAERLLRAGLRATRKRELDEQIARFYEELTPVELEDERVWTHATARAAARGLADSEAPRRRRR